VFRPPRSAAACRNRPGPASSGQGSNAACGRCTTPLHKTHSIAGRGEVRVCYEMHPWFGRAILLHEVIERSGGAVARCSLTEAPVVKVQEIPAWMLDAPACGPMHVAVEPVAAWRALTELRTLLRDVMHHAADEMPNAGVASPEPHGEHRARIDLSTAAQATPTIGSAPAGETGAGGYGSPMEQLAGSDAPGAERPSDTPAGAHADGARLPLQAVPEDDADER